jgi:hypothetical protein
VGPCKGKRFKFCDRWVVLVVGFCFGVFGTTRKGFRIAGCDFAISRIFYDEIAENL